MRPLLIALTVGFVALLVVGCSDGSLPTAPSPSVHSLDVRNSPVAAATIGGSVPLKAVSVTISPSVVDLQVGQQRHFVEKITGLPMWQRTVDWQASCGYIHPSGLYTATEVGTCFVTATVRATGDSAIATVVVSTP